MTGLICAALCACLLPCLARAAVDAIEDKTIATRDGRISIDFHYPALGMDDIDADMAEWAGRVVGDFVAFYREAAEEQEHDFTLIGSYRIIKASERMTSVVWDIWEDTGGAHGQLDIVACVYDLRTGQLLDISDLFADEQKALNLMSAFSYRRLSEEMRNESMLRAGTAPDKENFATFAPTPEGLRIFFPPYQVAPWVDGPQEVDMPLEELRAAGPLPEYWGGTDAAGP
jgi:hypothetical protein